MKIRVIKQGDETFTYDGEDEHAIRQALLHDDTGIPGAIVYDITDLDRSDMDAGEYLIATEDDGTPVWSGWLGGVQGPAPAGIAGDVAGLGALPQRGESEMITIYGASDDLVEVAGCEGADEFNVYPTNWHADLVAPDGSQMRVQASYERNGCWSVGAAQVDEDVPFPAWPVKVRGAVNHEPRYSAVMEIDAPDGTRLTNVHPAPGQ